MHHVLLESWSRGSSAIHRRDPRAKLGALAVFLVVLATAHRNLPIFAVVLLLLLCAVLVSARLPLGRILLRASVVLLFAAALAFSSWISGDPGRAVAVVLKSYLSALAVLVVVSTTPMHNLLKGLESLGIPHFLLMVVQFVYRYLFTISEEAQHMRKAIAARGGARWAAAAGSLAGLFARSYSRAGEIHRAMLARGFAGHFQALETLHFRAADVVFLVSASLVPLLLRFGVERLS